MLTNPVFKQFEAQAGAAAHIEHGLSAPQAEPADSKLAKGFGEGKLKVVYCRTQPVLYEGGVSVRQ